MRVAFLSLLIWLVATAMAIFVACLLLPANVSWPVYIARLAFVAWLVTANKAPSLLIIWVARKSSSSRYGGVLGSLHILTFVYSIVAGLVFIAHVAGMPFLAQDTVHLVIQVVSVTIMTLIGLCIALAVEAGA